jgi:predicted CXXCH cytochrome family protein
LTTRHAVAYDSVAVIQNNPACLPCHTTGWDTTQANGGFDDFYLAQPPDQTGITKMKNVQCEACHGPVQYGGNHGQASTIRPEAEVCGGCHQGAQQPYLEQWSMSRHARSDSSDSGPALTNLFRTSPTCSGCHTYQGFLEFAADSGAFDPDVQNPPGDQALSLVCAACHEPHGNGIGDGYLRIEVADLCTKCHNPEYPPDSAGTVVGQEVHHSTAYMFEGIGGYEYPGFTYSSSPHTFVVTEKCATCHVYMAPFQAGPPEVPAETGHEFLPSKYACGQAGCHATIDTSLAEDVIFNYHNRQTEMDSLAIVLAGFLGTASNAADSASLGFQRAKFNYDFFEADGSHGVHNTNYARALLQSAIDNFSLTGVAMADETVPMLYALEQNYPNPFNPSTEIQFSVPVHSPVRMEVFDMSGQRIATLLDQEMAPGTYRVTWNGTGAAGRTVASGVYLYRIQAGSFVATRKMVFVK